MSMPRDGAKAARRAAAGIFREEDADALWTTFEAIILA